MHFNLYLHSTNVSRCPNTRCNVLTYLRLWRWIHRPNDPPTGRKSSTSRYNQRELFFGSDLCSSSRPILQPTSRKTMGDHVRFHSHGHWSSSPRICTAWYAFLSLYPSIPGSNSIVAMYIIARMLLGFGIVFAIISGSAMIGELAYPKERPIMTSLFNASYFFGAIIAAAISLRTAEIGGNWAWRIPSLLQCFPSVLQIFFVL